MYIRKDINGTSPLDIKNMNDNLRYIWMKVFGDMNMADMQTDVKNVMYTNWLPFQGEGNVDANHPLVIRFFVPPNTKEVKSSTINIITSRYRVDSDITSTEPEKALSSTYTSESGGSINISDNQTVTLNWSQGEGSTYLQTRYAIQGSSDYDTASGNHKHDIAKAELDHYHNSIINIDPHTHNVKVDITIPSHSHELNMGIKEADAEPSGVTVKVNSTDLGISLTGDNKSSDTIDIKEKILSGQWNTVQISSTGASRVTVFGIAELLQNYK